MSFFPWVFQHVNTLVPEVHSGLRPDVSYKIQHISGAGVKGCYFHCSQAVMRKVTNLGLGTIYHQRKTTHHFMRKLLYLPYLPPNRIIPAFNNLRAAANTHLMTYAYDLPGCTTVFGASVSGPSSDNQLELTRTPKALFFFQNVINICIYIVFQFLLCKLYVS